MVQVEDGNSSMEGAEDGGSPVWLELELGRVSAESVALSVLGTQRPVGAAVQGGAGLRPNGVP